MRFLLEVGTEEIPARFLIQFKDDLKKSFELFLLSNKIQFADASFWATGRRLAFIAEGVNPFIEKSIKKVAGPPIKIAYDSNLNPTRALVSFCEKNGISDLSKVQKEDGEKSGYVYVEIEEGGESVDEILREKLPFFIESIKFPKEMKWASYDMKFVRPVRWLVALYGDSVVNFNYNHLKSSRVTFGARFKDSPEIELLSSLEYEKKLMDNCVIVNHNKRFSNMKGSLEEICTLNNASYFPGDEMIWENVFLTEFGVVDVNSIAEKFLELPDRVLGTSIAVNQKYFTFYSKQTGKLLPFYAFVYDLDKKFVENVKRGSGKVISARLNDALFFYHEDRENKLETVHNKLKGVLFQKEAGSMYNKVARVGSIAREITEHGEGLKKYQAKVERVVSLMKNDLVTSMVSEKEFASLQGYIGRVYLEKDGEDGGVCLAVEQHYYPRFADDIIPENMEGRIAAIADKVDTIAALFSSGKIPTGSQDPYALRRSALGIIRIVVEGGIDISIADVIKTATGFFKDFDFAKQRDIVGEIISFFEVRLKAYFADMGLSHDVSGAVSKIFMDKPLKAVEIAKLIDEYKPKKEFEQIIFSYKRIKNIIDKGQVEQKEFKLDATLFESEYEKNLFDSLGQMKSDVKKFTANSDYKCVFDSYISINTPLAMFFDKVMVNVENEKIKNNRLALLVAIKNEFEISADFSEVVYEKKG